MTFPIYDDNLYLLHMKDDAAKVGKLVFHFF